MDNRNPQRTVAERREALAALRSRRIKLELDRRGDKRNYSAQGMVLFPLLQRVQAWRGMMGMPEFTPRRGHVNPPAQFSPCPPERATQRVWLEQQIAWLKTLMEETLEAVAAIDAWQPGPPDEPPRETHFR